MEAKISHIGLCLALAAGLLLVAGVAWAQAIKTPISGEWTGCRSAIPQPGDRKDWTDSDGVRHVRNYKQICRITGDIVGRTVELCDVNWDPATGDSHTNAYSVFTGELLGEATTAVIRWVNECNPEGDTINCEEDDVWHFEDGSKANLVMIYEHGSGPPLPYAGILVDPPGRN